MKKICLFSVILSMFAMSACSEKEAHEGIPPVNGASEVNYLSIKIANPVSTRANGFEDGTGEEGKVNTVHFFFYDKDGNPARVIAPTAANQEYTNYFVVNAPQLTPDASDDSIESSLDAIVVVDTEKGDLLPEYMLTVANVPAAVLTKSATYTKDQLVADIEDFTTTATGPFVMSNSVYLDGTAVQNVDYVAGSFQKSKTLAAQNPVTVYIERVVAKVGVTNAIAASDGAAGTYATGQTDDKTAAGEKVYVKLNTWNLTAVADKSYLVKKITANMAPGFAWNDAANHRSYWAIIPSTVNLLYNSYAQATSTVNAAANYLYCQENTTDDGTAPLAGERTQVIVMATLCDKTGAAMEIAEWRGVRMTKADLCASIVSCPQIKEYNLNAADLAFTTVSAYKNNSAAVTDVAKLEASKRYLVVAQLTESAAATAADKAAEINTALAALGDMKIWADGKAYYYFDIAHDTATEGGATIYGVVRNHVYNATLNSVAGLGTPVFDPEEPIIPEKIQEDESYLAAEIKVLAWKVVNQGVDL